MIIFLILQLHNFHRCSAMTSDMGSSDEEASTPRKARGSNTNNAASPARDGPAAAPPPLPPGLTREERKLWAILHVIQRMEKSDQRRRQSFEHRVRGGWWWPLGRWNSDMSAFVAGQGLGHVCCGKFCSLCN